MSNYRDSVFFDAGSIANYDAELWTAMLNETSRQEEHIELIASENYASKRVLEAQGSLLTINMLKDTPLKDIMVAASMLILLKNLQLSEQKSYLMQIMQMYSRILALLLMLLHF